MFGISSLYLRVAGYALVLAAIVGAGFWLHNRWYNDGVHSRDAEVAALNQQIGAAATALNAANAASAKAIADAKVQHDMAQAALDEAEKQKQITATTAASYAKQFAAANKTPACSSVTRLMLCPALDEPSLSPPASH